MRVFRKARKKNGKSVRDKYYTGRYRLAGEHTEHDIGLGVSDKQVAEKKLREFVKEMEQERMGILAPRRLREAAQTSLKDLLEDFLKDLKTRQRSPAYVNNVRTQIYRLIKECKWERLHDVSPDAFMKWRNNSRYSPKTNNEHLGAINAFLNWLIRYGKAGQNPIKCVPKQDGRPIHPRRALTDGEIKRLLAVAPLRAPFYFTALCTGLRRNELRQLLWGDVHLNADEPFIRARASTTKNKKDAHQPVHPLLATVLEAITPLDVKPSDKVFTGAMAPSSRQQNRDFEAAGIPKLDHLGQKADLHALRKTFGTKLANSGVAPRIHQELMRHSDPRLTMQTYTDRNALKSGEAINKINFLEMEEAPTEQAEDGSQTCPLMRPLEVVQDGQNGSRNVNLEPANKKASEPDGERSGGESTCQSVSEEMAVLIKKWGHADERHPTCPL